MRWFIRKYSAVESPQEHCVGVANFCRNLMPSSFRKKHLTQREEPNYTQNTMHQPPSETRTSRAPHYRTERRGQPAHRNMFFSPNPPPKKASYKYIAYPCCIASRIERRTAAGDLTKELKSISAVTEAGDASAAAPCSPVVESLRPSSSSSSSSNKDKDKALALGVPPLSLPSELDGAGETGTGRGRRGVCTAARAAFRRGATAASPAAGLGPDPFPLPETCLRLPERRREDDAPDTSSPPPAAASSAASCTASSTGLASNGTLRIRCRARAVATIVLSTPADKPPGGGAAVGMRGAERTPLSHAVT